MRKFRIAIDGLGFIAKAHIDAYARLAARGLPIELAAACDLRQSALAALPQGIRGYPSLEDMLAREELDAVDICTPTHTHEQAAAKCLAAGLHVVCEKPMALDVAACERMILASESAGTRLMIAHPMRFFAPYRRIKRILEDGSLGAVRNMLFTRCDKAPKRPQGWILDPARSGGAVLDLQIHDLDAAQWLLGMPASVSASAHTSKEGLQDAAHTRLDYAGGVSVGAYAEWLPYDNTHISRTGRVNFEDGYAYFDLERNLFRVVTPKGEENWDAALDEDFYLEELRYFCERARENAPIDVCPPCQSMASVALARMASDSARSGETIHVPRPNEARTRGPVQSFL